MEKTCKQCGNTGTNFRKSRKICINCQRQENKNNYYKNHSPEDQRKRCERQKERRLLSLNSWLLCSCKGRAKKSGLEFNLEKEDLVVPEFCPVLGIKLFCGKGRMIYNSPTVDRIDNKLGYIKGNIKIISWRANCLKNNAEIFEVEAILKYMKEHE